jgi:hypothetical protein
MHALKARVEKGYLVMKEPTDLPEGQEVHLTIVTDDELALLDAAIEESYADEAAGRTRDLFEAFPNLRPNS